MCHAETVARHFLLFGNPDSLELPNKNDIRNMRKRLISIILERMDRLKSTPNVL